MNNWAKYAEKAGNNFEVIKYQGAQPDQSERDRVLLKLANRGANSGTDLPMGVSHEVTNMSSSSQNQLFENQFKALNDEMSKLVLGQTMTTEDGSSQSQAEVHERTQETIFDSDSKNLIDTLNYEFQEIGIKRFDLEPGGDFVYAENMNAQTSEMIEVDTALKALIPLDNDYLYEKYNIPKPSGQISGSMIERLGVGGLQALQAVLIDPTMPSEQKRNVLEIVFGMDAEKAERLAG
jgi:hypothetical protein